MKIPELRIALINIISMLKLQGDGATHELLAAQQLISYMPASSEVQSGEQIMRYFSYEHLPPHLQVVSLPFALLAHHLLTLPHCPERSVALRKLLEGKDAAVRAALL